MQAFKLTNILIDLDAGMITLAAGETLVARLRMSNDDLLLEVPSSDPDAGVPWTSLTNADLSAEAVEQLTEWAASWEIKRKNQIDPRSSS